MHSLRARILFTASIVLLTFLGCAGVLLDRAFRDSAMDAVEDRLRGRVFLLIGAADFDAADPAVMIDSLPDPSLTTPGSGHYARILADRPEPAWQSRSLLGTAVPLPASLEPGEWRLDRVEQGSGQTLFSLAYAIIWEGAGSSPPRRFTVQALENEKAYRETVRRFRRNLWSWFTGLSAALLIVQLVILNRGLRPLRQVEEEVRAIERGDREAIVGDYPSELRSLTSNLNDLLTQNRASLKRYRNALGDLAHSLKTPLAVLRSQFESGRSAGSGSEALEQLARIDRTVEYQLHRAAAAGRSLMRPPTPARAPVERVCDSLRKVHAARDIDIAVDVADSAVFPGDEGDLMEIVGNLADNACKWARSRVEVRVRDGGRTLTVEIADDGPGIPSDKLGALLERGARLDSSVEGHGIGLAIVREIVEDAYRGSLSFHTPETGTVARVEIPLR